ncbi:MAG: Imm1 family immunity protein [Methyloceanibacter sp.]|uniref:Imm1 family immunity protein n=1 Tax=Methyloceanibacter sp. TaxID=1965321 RepID=UPI003D6D6F6B
MRKSGYFDSQEIKGWPDPLELRPYFYAPPGQEWFHTGGNDGASIEAEGVDGSDALPVNKGRIDIRLLMWGIPKLGVLLIYTKWGGGSRETYSSKGDLRRLSEWVHNLHNTPLPVGLFIPFPDAYEAVKEFIETDGQLPKCIEWVANKNLPPGTFPDP